MICYGEREGVVPRHEVHHAGCAGPGGATTGTFDLRGGSTTAVRAHDPAPAGASARPTTGTAGANGSVAAANSAARAPA